MDFWFDKDGFKFLVLGALLVSSIFYFGNTFAKALATIELEQQTLSQFSSISPDSLRPRYKTLSGDATIFSNQNEVLRERDRFIAEKENFIFADLAAMNIIFYHNGNEEKKFAILSKGKNDTLFETPSGVYKTNLKEENHFSSIGKVWMPWSMHFYGNYFIHGWPYYPGGRAVSSTYSGGCIRLLTKDAQELFLLTTLKTPILVYSDTTTLASTAQYFKKNTPHTAEKNNIHVSATSILAADFETGQILLEKDSESPFSIASITKLMTALVAVENINRFKPIMMTKSAKEMPEYSSGVPAGVSLTAEEWLYPLLIASANDVAALLASQTWNFVFSMNEKARAVGLTKTKFFDPSGINPENISSARDLFKLLQFLDLHKHPLFTILGLKEYTATAEGSKTLHRWTRHVWQAEDPHFIAGKSGKTPEAGETFAGVFTVQLSEFEKRTIAIIVLQSQDRVRDIEAIRTYVSENFVYGTTQATRQRKGRPLIVREGASLFQAIENLGMIK